MAFLCKGPRFMMRSKLDLVEFETEVEKMVVKRKFREKEEEDGEGEEKNNNRGNEKEVERKTEEDKRIKEEKERLGAQARMVYNKESKCLDMGNLRASDYKFNRNIHLPKSDDVQKESKHNIRREEMLRVFNQVLVEEKEKEYKKTGKKGENKKEVGEGENLTKEEWLGLKSLRKKVKENLIVITETDKSKRFCVLTPEQYVKARTEH